MTFAFDRSRSDNGAGLVHHWRLYMRAQIHASLPLILVVIGLACSSGKSGKLVQDAIPDMGRADDLFYGGDICMPKCDGKACGDNGCGGNCGQCEMIIEMCDDEGQCVPAPCQSSLDCPSSLVCDKRRGKCVVCVGDEDCSEETTCGADHECHKPIACNSDKDCKEMQMVCDKASELCVDCLGPEECAGEEYCLGGYCVTDKCLAGEARCVDSSVEACADDGSAWQVTSVCGADQHCLDGTCHDNVCAPGEDYCDEDVAKSCDAVGSEVVAEEDCDGQDLHCYNGACTASVCPANETFCMDDITAAACSADGMSFITASCQTKQYCDGGTCHNQTCEPSSTFCEKNMVTVCNSKGSAIQSTTDCGGLVCVAGGCHALVCTPATLYCDGKALMECDANGTASSLIETCADDQYCSEDGNSASCHDQLCVPDSLSCDGTTIVQCDVLGATRVPGTDCAESDKGCLNGECITAYCGDGIKQDGEECDDGNEFLWDGCTYGCVSEGTGAHVFDKNWEVIPDPGIIGPRTYSFWFKAAVSGGTQGLLIKKDKPGGIGDPPAKPVKIYLHNSQIVAVVEPEGVEPIQVGKTQVGLGWTHVNFQVSEQEAMLFVNGINSGTAVLPGANIDNTHGYAVGTFPHGGTWYDFYYGQVYGLRISHGVAGQFEDDVCLEAIQEGTYLIEGEGGFGGCGP